MITIITPTYNRAYTLNKLYKSLVNQTNNKFEWLIIDDGSTDNTKTIIENYIKENKIKIKYFYKKNGGKHRALNYGIKKINSELTFIVDSDDWLIPTAIEKILKIHEKYKFNEKIACYSFHRVFPNGKISGPHYEKKEFIDNYIKYRINKHIVGEGAEIVKTKYFKEIPFLEIDNEKFLSEGYFWIKLAMKYDTVYIDEGIYVFNYLEDGLTKNLKKLRNRNPKGIVEIQKLYFNNKFNIIAKIKAIIKYITYGKIAKIDKYNLYKECNCKIIYVLFYPLGYLYYLKNRNI